MTETIKSFKILGILGILILLVTAPAAAYDEDIEGEASYSLPRVIEGRATLTTAEGDREAVEIHVPILVGDRLDVAYDSRLEILLADRGLLRIEGEAVIDFDAVAASADTYDRRTILRLYEGEIQLVVPAHALGDELPVVETPDGYVEVHRAGAYRLRVGRHGTELVVREGRAELVADGRSIVVYPDEEVAIAAAYGDRFDVRPAGRRDGLERWGERLAYAASAASVPYVHESIRYAAAPLYDHGVWVTIGGRRAWRPRVDVVWRPFSHGYWRTTRIGVTWVSYDSWGYVTHHYGDWDYVPGYGWLWYPDHYFAPARVHWYWGPDYVGWIPSGYYARHYGHHGPYGHGSHGGLHLRFGVYGYAGGHFDLFSHWNFTATLHFGHRRQDRHVRSGAYLARHHGGSLERGVITTDPGFVGRKNPEEVLAGLRQRAATVSRSGGVPDVTDFIAKKPLDQKLESVVLAKPSPSTRTGKPSAWTTAKPAPQELRKPVTGSRMDVAKPAPGKPSVGKPDVREPAFRKPAKPTPRVEPSPRSKPAPRVTPPSSYKPSPRVKPTPRVTPPSSYKPSPRSKPTPRVTPPSSTKPTPRVTPPSSYKPSPRSKPVPRAMPPSSTKPTPRVTPPSSSKPTPRAKPAPKKEPPTKKAPPKKKKKKKKDG